jgi:transcriptional regulator with XRE-family HTH domain
MLSKFIHQMRKKNNLTQEFLANKLGVSRPTYCQIENGERDITVNEAKKLADIFGIKFNDFLEGKENEIIVKLEKEKKDLKEIKTEIRIDVPQKNIKKLKEVLLYVLSKVSAKPNVGETVIYKLLYFIDFDYYEKYEEQLIGATYIKNHYGPTPVEFKMVVADMIKKGEIEVVESKYFNHIQKKYLPTRDANLSILNAQELQLINDVIIRLSDKNANELSNYSHEDIP